MTPQRNALIGSTGFMGSYLQQVMPFTALYHSKNIVDIARRNFDTIICTGTPSVKWLANKEPERDRESIAKLEGALETVTAKHFILISTVDVFAQPTGADEDAVVPTEELQPYGLHRLEFESFIRNRFANTTILRLPAMFGPGLRKNALYDLIHDNEVEKVPRQGVFQWYDLRQLPQDIERAAALPLVHLVTEPLSMLRIIETCFPDKATAGHDRPAAHYDLHTRYAAHFGGTGSYIASADTMLARISEWVETERKLLNA